MTPFLIVSSVRSLMYVTMGNVLKLTVDRASMRVQMKMANGIALTGELLYRLISYQKAAASICRSMREHENE